MDDEMAAGAGMHIPIRSFDQTDRASRLRGIFAAATELRCCARMYLVCSPHLAGLKRFAALAQKGAPLVGDIGVAGLFLASREGVLHGCSATGDGRPSPSDDFGATTAAELWLRCRAL